MQEVQTSILYETVCVIKLENNEKTLRTAPWQIMAIFLLPCKTTVAPLQDDQRRANVNVQEALAQTSQWVHLRIKQVLHRRTKCHPIFFYTCMFSLDLYVFWPFFLWLGEAIGRYVGLEKVNFVFESVYAPSEECSILFSVVEKCSLPMAFVFEDQSESCWMWNDTLSTKPWPLLVFLLFLVLILALKLIAMFRF